MAKITEKAEEGKSARAEKTKGRRLGRAESFDQGKTEKGRLKIEKTKSG